MLTYMETVERVKNGTPLKCVGCAQRLGCKSKQRRKKMEDKHLVFFPDDVYKELKKIGKEFNDADDPETIAKTIAILIYSFKLSTRFWEVF